MNHLNWNRQRERTRRRLLDYFPINESIPEAIAQTFYPIVNSSNKILKNQLYTIAKEYGYQESIDKFLNKFIRNEGILVKGTLNTFPIPGNQDNLYLDQQTEILYYFKIVKQSNYTQETAVAGSAIVGQSKIEDTQQTELYIYQPVHATAI